MLVCNVSLRPPRAGITAGLVEAVSATDATATGNIVFATLVDDPASVGDRVDAYSGQIMLEPASAAVTVNAGLTYATRVDEAATAAAVLDGNIPAIKVVAMVEAASAHDSVSVAAPTIFTTMGTIAIGPLFAMDATFSRSSLTVINVGP